MKIYTQQVTFNHQILKGSVILSWDSRLKSRLHAVLETGEEIGIILPRGHVLRGGAVLKSETSPTEYIQVIAAHETVSEVSSQDAHLLSKACYHLGNRHVALQIDKHYLRYQHDHVLDDMLQQMGLEVRVYEAPFEPESGAYHTHPHSH